MCLFCWTQRKIFWRMRETEQFWIIVIFSPTMEVNGAPKQPDYKLTSKYLPLCSEQRHSYRFGSTWGWVNDDRIFIFGCTVPLRWRKLLANQALISPKHWVHQRIESRLEIFSWEPQAIPIIRLQTAFPGFQNDIRRSFDCCFQPIISRTRSPPHSNFSVLDGFQYLHSNPGDGAVFNGLLNDVGKQILHHTAGRCINTFIRSVSFIILQKQSAGSWIKNTIRRLIVNFKRWERSQSSHCICFHLLI